MKSLFILQQQDNIKARIKTEQKSLEIGPFANPILTGENVYYFDVLTSLELHERAKKVGYNTEKIPQYIHFVSPTGDLSIINEKFDNILSCHSVEHTIDLVQYFKDVENLLIDDGKYYCIIPDKRFCFDHFMNSSTVAEVIDAHLCTKNSVHSLKSLIEHRAFMTHNKSHLHWMSDHGTNKERQIEKIKQAIQEFKDSGGKYIDVHKWYFTPSTFNEIVNYLCSLNLINMTCTEIYKTEYGSFEFFAVLAKPLKLQTC